MLISTQSVVRRAKAAFSIVELLVSLSILVTLFTALYAGFSFGYSTVRFSREDLRATQILQEKTETIRLYTWDQLNTAGFIPPTFEEDFFTDIGSGAKSGITYTGTVSIADAPITESYKTDLKQVTFEVEWMSGGVLRKREMTTLVSQYGIQNYVY